MPENRGKISGFRGRFSEFRGSFFEFRDNVAPKQAAYPKMARGYVASPQQKGVDTAHWQMSTPHVFSRNLREGYLFSNFTRCTLRPSLATSTT